MKTPVRLFSFLLLGAMAACQGDREAPDMSAEADAAAVAGPVSTAREAAASERLLDTSFDLPAGDILSIRLQPTTSTRGRVTFSKLALVTGDLRTDIDVCADKRLQLVRSSKVPGGEGCLIEFGNGSATGWIAPSELRNLPASSEPRRLEVVASGDLEREFRVYLDVGNGYGSRDMLRAESVVPAANAAGG